MDVKINIFSQNVRGLNNPVKRKRLFSHFSMWRPDILILQETHLNADKTPIFSSRHFPLQFKTPGMSKSRGVAILVSPRVNFNPISTLRDDCGRYLFVNGMIDTKVVTLVALYAPNVGKLAFIQKVLIQLHSFSLEEIIRGGGT